MKLRSRIPKVAFPQSPVGGILAAAIFVLSPSMAGATDEFTVGRLIVHHPHVEMAGVGTDSRLHLRLENSGDESIHIVGVSSPVARNFRIQLDTGDGSLRTLGSLTVPAREGADLSRSNVRITLEVLRRRVRAGDRVGITLHTVEGYDIPFTASVGATGIGPSS